MAEPWEPQPGERYWFHGNVDRCAVTVGERGAMWPEFVKLIVRIGTEDHDGTAWPRQLSPMSAVDQLAELVSDG